MSKYGFNDDSYYSEKLSQRMKNIEDAREKGDFGIMQCYLRDVSQLSWAWKEKLMQDERFSKKKVDNKNSKL